MFDVYLPVVALAPAVAYFQATDVSATTASVIAAMIFVATLLGRPVGAAVFGHLGDKIGRRRTAIISVAGFGVVTLLLAMMPGYQQIGLTAVVLMIVLRFIDGVFLGGEYTAASPLAMEYSPKQKRGLNGAIIMTGFPLAYCAISLLTLLTLQIAPAGDLDSPYVQWGWRIPFVFGALLAFAFVFYYARYVPESDVWEKSERSSSPLRDLLRGQNLRSFMQVFLMMTGVWLTLFMVSAVLPEVLKSAVGLSDGKVTTAVLLASAAAVGGYLAAGVLSQRYGRRPMFIGFGIVSATIGAVVYAIVVSLGENQFGLVIPLVIVINVLVLSCWGIVTTYVNERFHTGVRASGFGLGYTLAVIIPSFYAFYQTGLSAFMAKEYTPVVLLVIGGALMSLGAALGPESRDVDIRDD
ncbi:MAG: MFS transporter [Pseudonocardiaceae bacterium]|nr:MFS transporter [Pseudonocardiaceae bacterium]